MGPLQRDAGSRSMLAIVVTLSFLVALLAVASPATRAASSPASAADGGAASQQQAMLRYAEGTWASFEAMVDDDTGLPTDQLHLDGTRSPQTSTTNIGAYMWSAVAAERLGIISRDELLTRLSTTVTTLEGMERHAESGQFFNWYDHRTGEKITIWPPSGEPHEPRLSSVDNAWLAVGLQVVRNSVPELAARAGAIYDGMNFGFYYVPERNQIRFHYEPGTGQAPCCYDTIVSESRIASLIGISKGEIPPRHYFGAHRAFPANCDWSWTERRPVGDTGLYYDRPTFDGAYPYKDAAGNDTWVTPSWGGSMFEALMPSLFVPEEQWAPGSWGSNHPATVQAQIYHGLTEAGYGYWGFSPSEVPEGGYRTYGVDAVGMDPGGYPSNNDGTVVDYGYEGCREVDPPQVPPQSAYTNGVVTPHAAFLGLRFAPQATLANVANLERDFPGFYTEWGFRDSVNVQTGVASQNFLSLDQGMIMASLSNALDDDFLRRAFATPDMKRALRPVMAVEEFNSRPRGCTLTGTERADVLRGGTGRDVICALGGNDVVIGGGGDDVIFGDAGRDRVQASDGEDTVYGAGEADTLVGGRGRDVLSGGPGDDDLAGGPGDDHHEGGEGANSCDFESPGDTGNACS